jgi:hypothetical protein
MKPYLVKMTEKPRAILKNPASYTGISAAKGKAIAEKWRKIVS